MRRNTRRAALSISYSVRSLSAFRVLRGRLTRACWTPSAPGKPSSAPVVPWGGSNFTTMTPGASPPKDRRWWGTRSSRYSPQQWASASRARKPRITCITTSSPTTRRKTSRYSPPIPCPCPDPPGAHDQLPADQTRTGRVVRGGRAPSAELSQRVLHAQPRLLHVRVQGHLLRPRWPHGPQRVRALSRRASVRGGRETAMPLAHVPGSHRPVRVQAMLVDRDGRGDLFGMPQQTPAAVVRAGLDRADVRAVLAVQADIRERSRGRAGELLPEFLS